MSGKIPAATARTIAKKHGLVGVIVIGINTDGDGMIHLATYGKNKELCVGFGKLGERIVNFVKDRWISGTAML